MCAWANRGPVIETDRINIFLQYALEQSCPGFSTDRNLRVLHSKTFLKKITFLESAEKPPPKVFSATGQIFEAISPYGRKHLPYRSILEFLIDDDNASAGRGSIF